MNKIPFSILFLLLTCAACFAQSTYMGITPGKSTRADIERILGQPVQSTSETLIQYKPRWGADKIYVQYSDDSADAVVHRMELVCAEGSDSSRCDSWHEAIRQKYRIDESIPDAHQKVEGKFLKVLQYFGAPLFMVRWKRYEFPKGSEAWAFYSKELFEGAVPKRGCTGTIFGDWETNQGRMTIVRVGDPIVDDNGNFQQPIKGTYSKNNGTFTGTRSPGVWDWKDDTGTGTMWINVMLGADTFSGEWERDTGKGPKKGKLVGRCVEAGNGND